MTRSISFSRPITGSSLPSRAPAVRFRPNWSSTSETDGAVPDGATAAAGSWRLGARQQLDHLLADPVGVSAQLDQHLRGDALALADQAEQDVLGADVVVAQLQRLPQRQLQHLLGGRSSAVATPLISATILVQCSSTSGRTSGPSRMSSSAAPGSSRMAAPRGP